MTTVRKLYRLGYIGYVFLFILSFVFYKERTIFTDNAYHLFFIIKDDAFTFLNFRYGAALTQVVPLISARLGLSLHAVLMLYSSCFIVLYTLCYFLCGTVCKNYKLALVLLFFNLLFVSDTFFWMLSELPQGVAFMMVVFSFLKIDEYTSRKWTTKLLAVIATIVSVIFFHPLMVFCFSFTIIYFLLHKKNTGNKTLLWTCLISFFIAVLLKKFCFSTEYERGVSGNMRNLKTFFPHYFNIYANKRFLYNCLTQYYWIPVISSVLAFVYIKNKEWIKLALFSLALLGYLFLINVSYPDEGVATFYIENLYLPLGLFLALPFVFDVLPLLQNKRQLAFTLVSLIIFTAAIRIYQVSQPYTKRLQWERDFLAEHKEPKLFVSGKLVPQKTLMMTWGTPYEFWLLSTLEYGSTRSIVVVDDVNKLAWAVGEKKSFVDVWERFPYQLLPANYFKFPDTSGYKILQ